MQLTKSKLSMIIAEEHDNMIKEKETGALSKTVHTALDVIGLVPGYGEWADVLNAVMHAKEGNYLLASLSAISVIPIVGDAIGKGGKTVIKLRRLFPKAMKQVEKHGPEVVKAVRAMRQTIQKNRKKIDKLLDLLEKEEGPLSEYVDEIRLAVDMLASPEETDESLTEKISAEMSGDSLGSGKINPAEPKPEELAAKKSAKKDSEKEKKSGAEDGEGGDDEKRQVYTGAPGGSSSGGSGTISFGPFGAKGKIKSQYLNFKEVKQLIDDVIKEGGYMKKTYKRDDEDKTQHIKGAPSKTNSGKFDYIEGPVLEEDDDVLDTDPTEEEADSKAPNLKTSNLTQSMDISEDEDDLGLDIEDRNDPVDYMDSRYDDRKHAYWVQDDEMWKAFIAARKEEVTKDTLKLLSTARAKLKRGESIEFIGKEGDPEHDINMKFQTAIEDHDPTFWLKKSKGSKMKESKKITRSMLKTILQEEYQKVLEEYGMKPQYDRDDGAELVDAGNWSGPLEDISNAAQEMIAKAYHLTPNEEGEYDDIFDVTLEQPPGDDNYMIRIQWHAPALPALTNVDDEE